MGKRKNNRNNAKKTTDVETDEPEMSKEQILENDKKYIKEMVGDVQESDRGNVSNGVTIREREVAN